MIAMKVYRIPVVLLVTGLALSLLGCILLPSKGSAESPSPRIFSNPDDHPLLGFALPGETTQYAFVYKSSNAYSPFSGDEIADLAVKIDRPGQFQRDPSIHLSRTNVVFYRCRNGGSIKEIIGSSLTDPVGHLTLKLPQGWSVISNPFRQAGENTFAVVDWACRFPNVNVIADLGPENAPFKLLTFAAGRTNWQNARCRMNVNQPFWVYCNASTEVQFMGTLTRERLPSFTADAKGNVRMWFAMPFRGVELDGINSITTMAQMLGTIGITKISRWLPGESCWETLSDASGLSGDPGVQALDVFLVEGSDWQPGETRPWPAGIQAGLPMAAR